MNRKEMEEVIRSGQGVLLKGQVFTRVEELPAEVDLVEDDPEAKEQLTTDLEKQVAQLHGPVRDVLTVAQPKNEQPRAEETKPEPAKVEPAKVETGKPGK